MQPSMSDALGGFGAKPTVKLPDGREYRFTLDVPLVVSHMEQLCLTWMREERAKVVCGLPERDTPGTLDHELARRSAEQYIAAVEAGGYKPGGPEFAKFSKTPEGRLASATACLKIEHPDITAREVVELITTHTELVSPVFAALGKVVAAYTDGMVEAVARKDPKKAAAMRKTVDKILKEGAAS